MTPKDSSRLLEIAEDNTLECLNEHIEKYGQNPISHKNIKQSKMYKNELKFIRGLKTLPTGKHECDCGRIVTDDEWDADGNWCNNCLASYFEDKDRDDDFTICPKTGDLRNNG